MSKHKKLLTSAVALGTAAALALGGTFAWQSISQGAVNEASDIVNPGGRLHNDQRWVSDLKNDTNIYVENFTDPEAGGETIYARVRLSEYMEVVMNYGVDGVEAVETIAGKKTPVEGSTYTADNATHKNEFTYEYAIHDFTKDFDGNDETKNPTSDFFQWTYGNEDSDTVYYMPTFNKNKDSLLADLNGEYVDTLGGISNRGENQYTYTYTEVKENSKAEGWEVWDGDSDTNDDVTRAQLKDLIANGTGAAGYEDKLKSHVALVDAHGDDAHEATTVGTTKDFISMAAWKKMVTDNKDTYVKDGVLTEAGRDAMYNYWVYDTDGWVYWSAPIKAGETTGLLLDSFELKDVMDDTWYYAINVEAQFVTPDDVGKDDGTGFYTVINAADGVSAIADGDEPANQPTGPITEAAEELLALLGVYIPEDAADDDTDDDAENTITDWSSRVKLRNITSPEYDLLCDATNEEDDRMHWGNIWTVTDTVDTKDALKRVIRGCGEARKEYSALATQCGNAGGFRPAFEASTADCAGLQVGDVRVMGTLYVGNEAVKVPTTPTYGGDMTAYDESGTGTVATKITLGAPLEDEAYQMKAVYVGDGLFVCDRCMLRYISWDQIDAALTPDTPKDDTTDDTTDDTFQIDTVTSTEETDTLTVQYKRAKNAQYDKMTGPCEFQLKPTFNEQTVTDTSKLSLVVNVDGDNKPAVTGDGFTDDGDGWLKCTVPGVFTDKTGKVTVTLTLTYAEGETSLTTAPYEITFTQR